MRFAPDDPLASLVRDRPVEPLWDDGRTSGCSTDLGDLTEALEGEQRVQNGVTTTAAWNGLARPAPAAT